MAEPCGHTGEEHSGQSANILRLERAPGGRGVEQRGEYDIRGKADGNIRDLRGHSKHSGFYAE